MTKERCLINRYEIVLISSEGTEEREAVFKYSQIIAIIYVETWIRIPN